MKEGRALGLLRPSLDERAVGVGLLQSTPHNKASHEKQPLGVLRLPQEADRDFVPDDYAALFSLQ